MASTSSDLSPLADPVLDAGLLPQRADLGRSTAGGARSFPRPSVPLRATMTSTRLIMRRAPAAIRPHAAGTHARAPAPPTTRCVSAASATAPRSTADGQPRLRRDPPDALAPAPSTTKLSPGTATLSSTRPSITPAAYQESTWDVYQVVRRPLTTAAGPRDIL